MRDPFSNECIVDCFDLYRGNAGLSGEIIFFDDAFTDQIEGCIETIASYKMLLHNGGECGHKRLI